MLTTTLLTSLSRRNRPSVVAAAASTFLLRVSQQQQHSAFATTARHHSAKDANASSDAAAPRRNSTAPATTNTWSTSEASPSPTTAFESSNNKRNAAPGPVEPSLVASAGDHGDGAPQKPSVIPQPPPGPRPRIWPYGRNHRLPKPAPDTVTEVPREQLADWDMLRHDTVLQAFVNNFMRDGRKHTYERYLSEALFLVQQRTGMNPITVLHDAIDRAAPVMKIVRERKSIRVTEVPTPLTERQGTRLAITMILKAAEKRNELYVHERLAGELLSVYNGTSSVNKERARIHNDCLTNRANARIRLSF